jgi:hypothetical protein
MTLYMKRNTILLLALMMTPFIVAGGQQSMVPIVEMKTRGLLGGVQNGKWIDAVKSAARIPKDIELVLVGLDGVEEGDMTVAKHGEKEDVCEDFHRFEFELETGAGIAIGSSAKWNFTPRIPQTINVDNRTYKTAVADFLAKKGIARPVVKIQQAYRIDLDGDGRDEVLISATNYKKGLSSDAAVGDYSFVMLRTAKGKAVTDHLLKGDFITRKVDFGAPTQNEISAIADLNGDGKMEIILNGQYYEGEFASAFEFRNGRIVEIKEFEIGCGV